MFTKVYSQFIAQLVDATEEIFFKITIDWIETEERLRKKMFSSNKRWSLQQWRENKFEDMKNNLSKINSQKGN